MAKAILRFKTHHRNDLAGIEHHVERKKAFYCTNPKIDPARTPNNYALQPPTYSSYYAAIQRRITETNCKTCIRSISILALEAVITASPDLFEPMADNRSAPI